jgi:hypothetical protein
MSCKNTSSKEKKTIINPCHSFSATAHFVHTVSEGECSHCMHLALSFTVNNSTMATSAAAAASKADILNIARDDPFEAIAALVDDKQRQALKMQELEAKLDQLMSPPQQEDRCLTDKLKHCLQFMFEHPTEIQFLRLTYKKGDKGNALLVGRQKPPPSSNHLVAVWNEGTAFPLPGNKLQYGRFPEDAYWNDMDDFMARAFDIVRWGKMGWELKVISFMDVEDSESAVN